MQKLFLLFLLPFQIIKAEFILLFFGMRGLGNYIRTLSDPVNLLKYLGVKIGKGTLIYPGIVINCGNRMNFKLLSIGKQARILCDVIIDLNANVFIDDYAHVGARSSIITHYSLGKTPLGKSEYPPEDGHVIINKGVAIAWDCTILHNTVIGAHTIIASRSVIKGEIPDFCVFGGNPSRAIKKIIPRNMEDFK